VSKAKVIPIVACNAWQHAIDTAADAKDLPRNQEGRPIVKRLRNALTGAAIMKAANEPVRWRWEGIVADGQLVDLLGGSGEGKTTLACMMVVGMAANHPVDLLGHLMQPIDPGCYVVIVEEENSARSIGKQLGRACELLDLDPAVVLDRVVVLARQGVTAQPIDDNNPCATVWGEVIAVAKAGLVGALVIDSRARVLIGDKGEAMQAEIGRALIQLVEVCAGPVIVVSHSRKGGAQTLDDLSGHTQRAAADDIVLGVTAKKKDGAVLSTTVKVLKCRDIVDEHPAPMTYSIAKDDECWQLVMGEASSTTSKHPPHERLIELLASKGEPMTKAEIRNELNMSGDAMEKAITTAFAEKAIEKGKAKLVKGRPRPTFKAKAADQLGEWLGGSKAVEGKG